jgi:hypothetical protein
MRVLVLLALVAGAGFGATVAGVVKDPSGAGVAQATVTVGSATAATDSQGRFEFRDLPEGEYRIEVTREGFEPFSKTVPAGVPLTIQLKLAALRNSVEVSGRRSTLRNSDPNYIALRGGALRTVYRVKDLVLTRDVGTFTFRSGSFSFPPPVLGRVTCAVFIGEGSFELKPASVMAANHLKQISGASNLEEEFGSLVIYFSDSTFEEITAHAEVEDRSPKAHQDLLKEVQDTLRRREDPPGTYLQRMIEADDVPNMEAEILAELYNQTGGSFRAFIHGRKYSGLRFLLNPRAALPQLPAPEEVALLHYDWGSNADGIWYLSHTLAEMRARKASSMEEKRLIAPEHYRIETAIDHNLRLSVVCELRMRALREGVRAIKFDLLPDMQISRVRLDGREISFLQEGRQHDGSFYIVPVEPLQKDRAYQLSFEYDGGDLIRDVGSKLFLILPTQTWYPRVGGVSRATYDLSFQVPHGMTVIATGERVKSETEGAKDFTQWVSKVTLPVAGFNYGNFLAGKQRTDESNGFRLETFVGRENKGRFTPEWGVGMTRAENAVRVFEKWYGAAPYGRLAVTEANIQGSMPALIFAWALSMTDASSRYGSVAAPYDSSTTSPRGAFEPPKADHPVSMASGVSERPIPRVQGAMFDESLAREVSRQWWGGLMNAASFHEEWLLRGLADFSAAIYDMSAEAGSGDFLEHWRRARDLLLMKTYWGIRRNDVAPLWLGAMAEPFLTQRVARFSGPRAPFLAPSTALTGTKGGYVFHMLRGLMFDAATGDQDFMAMMHDFTSTFAQKSVTTEGFKSIVEKHMKPAMDLDGSHRMDWFFDEWVYGTELPSYSLEYSLHKGEGGKTWLRGKLTQSGVSERFRMRVPVYVKVGAKMVGIGGFRMAGSGTKEFRAELPEEPKKVLLNVNYDILCGEVEVRQVR